jgi:hypothetical protein
MSFSSRYSYIIPDATQLFVQHIDFEEQAREVIDRLAPGTLERLAAAYQSIADRGDANVIANDCGPIRSSNMKAYYVDQLLRLFAMLANLNIEPFRRREVDFFFTVCPIVRVRREVKGCNWDTVPPNLAFLIPNASCVMPLFNGRFGELEFVTAFLDLPPQPAMLDPDWVDDWRAAVAAMSQVDRQSVWLDLDMLYPRYHLDKEFDSLLQAYWARHFELPESLEIGNYVQLLATISMHEQDRPGYPFRLAV